MGPQPQARRKESERQARRRRAWWSVHYGPGRGREALSDTERVEVAEAIDSNKISFFGIERLARYDMTGRVPTQNWVKSGSQLSILRYASLRGRLPIVEALLRSGVRVSTDADIWSLTPAEAEIVESVLDKSTASGVVVAISRIMEYAAMSDRVGSYCWAWIERDGRRYVWRGCGCVVQPKVDAWRALVGSLRCPSCNAKGMPAPQASPKRRRKQRSLFEIARRGDATELEASSDGHLNARDDVFATPAIYAAIRCDQLMLEAMCRAGADLDSAAGGLEAASAREVIRARRALPVLCRPRAIGSVRPVLSGGVYVVDDAVPSEVVKKLLELYAATPISVSDRSSSDDIERRHFIDATGVLQIAFSEALAEQVCLAPQAKFLLYRSQHAEMKAHIDLAKSVAWLGETHRPSTSHTWILYLSDCPEGGGATVLLEDVSRQPPVERLSVCPRRNRLFVFPHRTPHAGLPLRNGDCKLLARGELYFRREAAHERCEEGV